MNEIQSANRWRRLNMFSSIDRRTQSGPAQLAGLTVAQYNAKNTADALCEAAHAPVRAQPADWPV